MVQGVCYIPVFPKSQSSVIQMHVFKRKRENRIEYVLKQLPKVRHV